MNHIRKTRLQNQLEQLALQPNIQVTECQHQGLSRNDLWVIWIRGRKGTLFQGGIYPVQITFPNQFPAKPPIITFRKDFLHIHVYEGGLICMPILQSQYWKPKSSMVDIVKRIQGLIHQEINKFSPANNGLYAIYKSNPNQYQKIIRQQAEKCKQKMVQYFHKPCVHIDIVDQ